MNYAVCSRESERDYTWDNSPSSHSVAECARNIFAPAFEGSLTTGRFVALLRNPVSPQGVMLCVSVSTARKDAVGRPIRTIAFFRATESKETALLTAFFAECLRRTDKETLYKAESPLAMAVESLYQTKELDGFIKFCEGLSKVDEVGAQISQRWAIPRDSMADRRKVANALPSLVMGGKPFLVVLTDRTATDVLGSLGERFDHAVVRIFSNAVDCRKQLPEPILQKHLWAAAIGGSVIVALLVAAIGPCSPTSKTDGGSNVETNRICAGGSLAAPAAQHPPQAAVLPNDFQTTTSTGKEGNGR